MGDVCTACREEASNDCRDFFDFFRVIIYDFDFWFCDFEQKQ